MKTLVKKTVDFLHSEDGPTATEYAVMLGLIVVLCYVTIGMIGNKAKATFTTIEGALPENP